MAQLFDVKGKVALVTGGSRGIGLWATEALVEGGATVYISSRGKVECERVAAELSAKGPGKCVGFGFDLSTEEGCKALADAIAERETKLHVLINNSGTVWGAPIEQHTGKAWDKVYNLNVKAPFLLVRFTLPLLRAAASESDPARVINIGSINGLTVPGLPTFSYSSSKAAVLHLTRHLANDLAPSYINVTAVAPGPFVTKLAKGLVEQKDAVMSGLLIQRFGEPDDIKGTILYLSSKAGAYLTGIVLPVDGGAVVRSTM